MLLDTLIIVAGVVVYLVSVVAAYAHGRYKHLDLRGEGLRTGEPELLGSTGGVRGQEGAWLLQATDPHEAVPWVDHVRRLVIREANPGDVLRVEVLRVGRMDGLAEESSS